MITFEAIRKGTIIINWFGTNALRRLLARLAGQTKRQSYTFTVKEYGDGTPYIACVPVGREWSVFGRGFLSFVLPMGTTLKSAQKAGAFLNKNIDLISFTEALGHAKYSRRKS